MKILVIDMEFDYGIKSRGLNCIGQDGFIKSFKALGHEVYPFYYDSYLEHVNYASLREELIKFAHEVKPDIIFHLTYTDQLDFTTLDYLKERWKTIAWFGDDQWRFDSFTRNYATHYSFCITTDKFALPKYHALGQKNIVLAQWGAIDTDEYQNFDGQYEFDVSFVGGKNPNREYFIHELEKKGIKVVTFGNGWENGMISSERMNEVFLKSKINLNLSNSQNYDIRRFEDIILKPTKNFFRRYKQDRKISKVLRLFLANLQTKNQEQMKARHFEIPYYNGFQLSYYYNEIADYFHIGKEIACFSSIEEAELLIKYYLENENKREEIKKASHELATNFTYKNILERVLERIINEGIVK